MQDAIKAEPSTNRLSVSERPKMTSPCQILELATCSTRVEQLETVVKTSQMEVMHLRIRAGSQMPLHEAEGDVVLQCLEGSIRVEFLDESHLITPRRLLYLQKGIPFSLSGIEDTSALVIINAPKQGENVELIGEHGITS